VPGRRTRSRISSAATAENSRSLLEDADAYEEVLDLAERIGVSIVAGKL
jgi:hypothetical protein